MLKQKKVNRQTRKQYLAKLLFKVKKIEMPSQINKTGR